MCLGHHGHPTARTVHGLAIGIGASASIFSVADVTLLNPLPFPQPDQLVTVNEIVPVIANGPIRLTAPDLVDYQEQSHSFDSVAGWTPRTFELSGERESERVQAIRGTASLFRALHVRPALGLRRVVQAVDPRLAVAKLQPLEETRALSTAPQRFNMMLMTGFAAVALLLAAIGIYGVVAYSVTQRTQEIGIRVALGADAADVVAMIVRGAAGLALAGVTIGAAAAASLAPTLRALLFGVAPLDPPTFAAVAVVLLVVAVIATYIPARRATRVDPLVALRSE